MNNVIELDYNDLVNGSKNEKYFDEDVTEDILSTDEKLFESNDTEDSFFTSEDHSYEEFDDRDDFEDSSEEISEKVIEESSDNAESQDIINLQRLGRKGWAKKRGNHKGKSENKKMHKKSWPKRRDEHNNRRFRNPHGTKVQKSTGRWQKIWQKFNKSKPALAGRWAGMYNRTRSYWNIVRDHTMRRYQHRQNITHQSSSEDAIPQARQREYTNQLSLHNHSLHWNLHNQTHHNLSYDWNPNKHTHRWNSRNHTHHHRSHGNWPHERRPHRFRPHHGVHNKGRHHGRPKRVRIPFSCDHL